MQIRKHRLYGALRTALVLAAGIAILIFFRKTILELAKILLGGGAIAFVIAPLCRLLEKRLKRPAAALVSLAVLLLVFSAAIVLVLPALLRQMLDLSAILPEAIGRIRGLMEKLAATLQAQVPGLELPGIQLSGMEGSLGRAAQSAISTISGLAGGIYRVFLAASLGYFFLADRDRILLRLELLVPFRWRRFAVRAGNTLLREMRLYLKGQATIALAVGCLAAAAMFFIGLKGAPVLGLFVGLFNVIPYFGPLLGGIPAVITALGIGWQRALISVFALFLVQQADGLLISPRVMGSITGFSPAVVLTGVFFGAQACGIPGMLFALPILLCIRTVYRVFVQGYENN